METLNNLDYAITLAINHFNCPAADAFMLFMSRITVWIPIYLAVIAWYFLKFPWKKALTAILVVLSAFAITDIGSNFFKETLFQRYRPCEDPALEGILRPYQVMVDGPGSLFGFPSGHACNTMCFALVTSWLSARRWWTAAFVSWSAVISYSRIYLGKHFFGDVICGWIFAGIVAISAICLLKVLFRKMDSKTRTECSA